MFNLVYDDFVVYITSYIDIVWLSFIAYLIMVMLILVQEFIVYGDAVAYISRYAKK